MPWQPAHSFQSRITERLIKAIVGAFEEALSAKPTDV